MNQREELAPRRGRPKLQAGKVGRPRKLHVTDVGHVHLGIRPPGLPRTVRRRFLTSESAKGHQSCALNREMRIQCDSSSCSSRQCSNRPFQSRVLGAVSSAGTKGDGLFATELIDCGVFITEYKGKRLRSPRGIPGVYCLKVSNELFIDARSGGNEGKFINHSCSPNAEFQKWRVGEQEVIGVFAIKEIAAGAEITVDYRYHYFSESEDRIPCHCGEFSCRRYI